MSHREGHEIPLGTWHLMLRYGDRPAPRKEASQFPQFQSPRNTANLLQPLTITISRDSALQQYLGRETDEPDLSVIAGTSAPVMAGAGSPMAVDHVKWQNGVLTFLRHGSVPKHTPIWEWYWGTIVEGILVGRFTPSLFKKKRQPRWPRLPNIAPPPGKTTPFQNHVTGWNEEAIDDGIVPRVFEIAYGNKQFGRLRLDGDPKASTFVGRLKLYAVGGNGSPGTSAHEELEYNLETVQWDGANVSFVRRDDFDAKGPWVETVQGAVTGRTVTGSGTRTRQAAKTGKVTTTPFQWSGTRAEVLSYGLLEKDTASRTAWQDRTRRQLMHLMLADNPLPVRVSHQLGQPQLPFTDLECQARDDNYPAWPRRYKRHELHLTYDLPYGYDRSQTLVRHAHGWLLLPDTQNDGPRRAVLTLNGHHGSAWKMMDPGSHHYWYADSFARRGFVVLALDVGHRNDSPLYDDDYSQNGDDSDHGNGPHPSIKAKGFGNTPDWEEDGERVWDAMRALDYLATRPEVDARCFVVTGLSMGGEVTTLLGALDPRIGMVIPTGYSPDASIHMRNGHACWSWANADTREYVDTSDYQALVAARNLIVESSKSDTTYSSLKTPFATDKQVMRRTRVAFTARDQGHLFHYLHDDRGSHTGSPDTDKGHQYRVGDVNPQNKRSELGVRTPVVSQPPAITVPGVDPLSWQTDSTTADAPRPAALASRQHITIFDFIDALLCAQRPPG